MIKKIDNLYLKYKKNTINKIYNGSKSILQN